MSDRVLRTMKVIAKRLGVSSATVWRYAAYEGLPVFKMASGPTSPLCIRESDLDAWLKSRSECK
ncbi:helix-turn-helix domain-containing protein [Ancylobacter sp. 6x-1]|uniref:Helix-turn-helix domain-containing protein n=1 Tax=Ancylobacter crimeensis TaxID=2579147 RepID=A0ABT0DAB3_9HYPH|nr:helix-turn-helix domain-containing protein [Ancylobacter crimeensis]MCK0196896.1 helix-turn-helix domain-containing protein [Ancylobacter crimeensis]